MGAAELVPLDEIDEGSSTLNTVLDLKTKGYKIFGIETTENATLYWEDIQIQAGDDDDEHIALVFGNELVGIDVQVLRECDSIVCLPTYGIKNSLNVANCVAIIVWDIIRKLKSKS